MAEDKVKELGVVFEVGRAHELIPGIPKVLRHYAHVKGVGEMLNHILSHGKYKEFKLSRKQQQPTRAEMEAEVEAKLEEDNKGWVGKCKL